MCVISRVKYKDLTVGNGGLDRLFIDKDGLFGGIVIAFDSDVGVIVVTGLDGCDKLCSGAWNV